jgi:type VI secretion system secreted protein VgrG
LPPEGQNTTGFRTRSIPGGGGYNELSFDDTAGTERLVMRAQTDMETFVGRDRKTRVAGSDVEQVAGRRIERVDDDVDRRVGGDEKRHVEGARRDTIEGRSDTRVGEDCTVEVGGAERHTIERTGWLRAGDDLTTETRGNHATVVGKHDARRSFALHVEGTSQLTSSGITEIVSPKGLRLRCGESFIEIMEDQILLMSDRIMLHAPNAQVEVNDDGEVWVDADDKAVLKATKVQLAGTGAMLQLTERAELRGQQISLCKPDDTTGLETEERELTTIELTDEDGEPLPNQRYILVFEDGREQSGFLDEDGRAEVYLEEGATVRFPGLVDVARGAAQ